MTPKLTLETTLGFHKTPFNILGKLDALCDIWHIDYQGLWPRIESRQPQMVPQMDRDGSAMVQATNGSANGLGEQCLLRYASLSYSICPIE